MIPSIELSPHPVLSAAVTECYQHHGKRPTVLPSLRRHEDERATMLHSLGSLHVLGQPIDWCGLLPEPRRFISPAALPLAARTILARGRRVARDAAVGPRPPAPRRRARRARPGWESRLDLQLAAYLADHRVQHAAIMPAAAYLELAFAAGREAFGAVGCELFDVKFANPCFLTPEGPLRLQTSFDPDSGMVHIHTRPVHGDRPWTVHFSAALRARPAGPGAPAFQPGAIRDRCPREFLQDECYDCLSEIGLDYGPMFQGIERAWQGDRESLALVRLAEPLEAEQQRVRVPAGIARFVPSSRDPGRQRVRRPQRRVVSAP